jgi:ribose 5-phosphate isomerase B
LTTTNKKRILIVCGGNTCRSPMAKTILEHKLKASGASRGFDIDSAAYNGPTYGGASTNAREAIKRMYGQDLLASHKAKKLTSELAEQADLILVMTARMKTGLPSGKTWTLKEYAGVPGDVDDPFGGDLGSYISCAQGIADAMDGIAARLLA